MEDILNIIDDVLGGDKYIHLKDIEEDIELSSLGIISEDQYDHALCYKPHVCPKCGIGVDNVYYHRIKEGDRTFSSDWDCPKNN